MKTKLMWLAAVSLLAALMISGTAFAEGEVPQPSAAEELTAPPEEPAAVIEAPPPVETAPAEGQSAPAEPAAEAPSISARRGRAGRFFVGLSPP